MTSLSVVMPCYNSSNTIHRSLKPFLESPFVNEVLVVDDLSTDNTVEVIQNLKTSFKKKLKLIQLEKNHGAGYARNVGANECSSEFIIFFDSDDIINPNLLEEFSKIPNLENFDLILFKYEIVDLLTNKVEQMYKDDEKIWNEVLGYNKMKKTNLSDHLNLIHLINYPWIRIISGKFFTESMREKQV